jgi:hypothetical protein
MIVPTPHLLTCAICSQSIAVEESKISEDGKPVHSECYYQKVKTLKAEKDES